VAVACWDDADWSRLTDLLGLDDGTKKRLASLEARQSAVEEVEGLVTSFTRSRTALEVAEALQAAGVEAVPVADLADASVDPQLAHRGHFVTLNHACMGECGYERNGFRLSDAPAGYERTSPLLGEHNEMVLGEILGLDGAEQARLLADGVLE
jgi:benzylsuccinate CoA-transferase BbsF subunit